MTTGGEPSGPTRAVDEAKAPEPPLQASAAPRLVPQQRAPGPFTRPISQKDPPLKDKSIVGVSSGSMKIGAAPFASEERHSQQRRPPSQLERLSAKIQAQRDEERRAREEVRLPLI